MTSTKCIKIDNVTGKEQAVGMPSVVCAFVISICFVWFSHLAATTKTFHVYSIIDQGLMIMYCKICNYQ